MSRSPDFRELVGEDLPADETERLHRVHELLVAAGPPAELSPELERVPEVGTVHLLPRRRRRVLLLLAAALAAAAFGAGFLSGALSHGGGKTTKAELVVAMHGTSAAPAALASIRLQDVDAAGNWPMKFTVQGLPKLPLGGYYELYLTRHGRIAAACGTFNVHAGKTTVTLNAPYELKGYDGWVVIGHVPGQRESTQPLLTT